MSKRTAVWLLLIGYLAAAGVCIWSASQETGWVSIVDSASGGFFLYWAFKRVRKYADD